MAASNLAQGYRCEFVDSVPEDFYCKECTLVARGLVMTDCCVESYCHSCITHSLQQGLPCPACGEQNFTIFHQKKYHKRINALKVYCSMRERGCVWSGTLDQLDAHLDPELDNCQYVDTKCPLNCPLSVPRNMVDQHVAQQCARRPHVCHHCGFKAPYQELVDTHLPQCKYVPLTCPNRCGVTCERDFLEDHMKMCRLEDIYCEFRGVGCDGRFIREDEDEHIRENSHKHLTLTASLAIQSKEQLLHKLLEQDKKHKEVEAEMKEKLQQQEKIIELQKKMLDSQKDKITHLEMKLEEQEQRLNQQEQQYKMQNLQVTKDLQDIKQKLKQQETDTKKWVRDEQLLSKEEYKVENDKHLTIFKKQQQKLEELQDLYKETTSTSQELKLAAEQQATLMKDKLSDLSRGLGMKHNFEMENFSVEKRKDKPRDWKSPAMYTHVGGYKFCIGVDANGHGGGKGKSLHVQLWTMPGEYDSLLKWPVKVKISIELINQQGEENAVCSTGIMEWTKQTICTLLCSFSRIRIEHESTSEQQDFFKKIFVPRAFLHHSDVPNFLINDTLYFNIYKIEFMQ